MRTAQEWVQEIAEAFNFKHRNEEALKDGDEVAYSIQNKIAPLFEAKLVDEFGGEDCGIEYWKVFKFKDLTTDEEVYIKWQGEYNSWESSQWEDDPFFVYPVERLVTFYEK